MPPSLPHLIIFNCLGVNLCRKSDCKKRSFLAGSTPVAAVSFYRPITFLFSFLDGEFDFLAFLFLIDYTHFQPHNSLGYRPPSPEAILSMVTT